MVAFQFMCFNNHIELSITLFSQLYKLGTHKNGEFWYFSSRKYLNIFDRMPSSLKQWKNKFFVLRHRTPEDFGRLQTSWHYWVELKKDKVRPRGEEGEGLASLMVMAKALRKIDITQVVRNVALS